MRPAPLKIWVDGELRSALSLPDRGLDYGDGLFETLLIRAGNALYFDLHMERLGLGLKALGFPPCTAQVEHHIAAALAHCAVPGEAIMRITVSRGAGERGYAPPQNCTPRIIVALAELPERDINALADPAQLILAKVRWSQQPVLAGIKHLNRLEQVLASQERQGTDADESIMLDQAGSVISVCAGNLFIVFDDKLCTPALDHCGVRGTRRRLVLESLAPQLGIETCEAEISLKQLRAATEVFYCSSVQGLRPVSGFESTRWDSYEVCEKLHRLYLVGAS